MNRRAFLLGSVSTLALAGVAVSIRVWPPVSSAMAATYPGVLPADSRYFPIEEGGWYVLTDLGGFYYPTPNDPLAPWLE